MLRGGAANGDLMDGGVGTEDMLDFSDGTVTLNFTLVQSAAIPRWPTAPPGSATTIAYRNIEGVIGTSFDDNITGSTGNDVIRGGAGNDTLNGAGGSDLIDFSEGAAGITFTLVNNGVGTCSILARANLGTDTYSGFEGVIGDELRR